MLPIILTATVLLITTIGFGSFHTWPFGFWNLAFELVWNRYYAIGKNWETEKPSQSVKSSTIGERLRETSSLSLAAVARWLLPLLLAIDGMQKVPKILYAPGLSFSNPYDTYLQTLGIILLTAAMVILIWADSFLARHVYGTPPKQRALLKIGPYRYIRHPVYLSFILFALGTLVLSLSYLMLITFAYFFSIAYIYRWEDEADLMQRYGKEYQEYLRTTGGFLPRF